MDWANERYVRVYVRDTPEWICLSWQARALFHEVMRKVDRAGVLPIGRAGARGLAALVRMPEEVVGPALAELSEDGCLELNEGAIIIPNFIEAQEAKQSDAHRARESRSRRRASALGRAIADVTLRDDVDDSVTNRDEDQTDRHEPSQPVTLCCAVPSCTDQPPKARDGESGGGWPMRISLDTPYPAELLQPTWDGRTMMRPTSLVAAEEWQKFVDYCMSQDVPRDRFNDDVQLKAWWAKWIGNAVKFEQRDRVKAAGNPDARPRRGTVPRQPAVSTEGWAKPIVAKPGDGDASTFNPDAP